VAVKYQSRQHTGAQTGLDKLAYYLLDRLDALRQTGAYPPATAYAMHRRYVDALNYCHAMQERQSRFFCDENMQQAERLAAPYSKGAAFKLSALGL
jgi:hypothetical protein